MPHTIALWTFVATVCTSVAPFATYGDEPPIRSQGGRSGHSDSDEGRDSLKQEVAALKQAIEQLEKNVNRLLAQPSQFSPVDVKIVDEQGKPMSGFEVRLSSVGDVQAANATGVSNDDGVGLARSLPYGRYRMIVQGNGWYVRDVVTVEVGKPLNLTVVAPTPDQLGELVLHASLSRDAASGLPFGEWEVKSNNGWGTRIVPQPEQMQDDGYDDWKTFPTVSDGIDVVAVTLDISIERQIEQPVGNPLTWVWRQASAEQKQLQLKWLVQSDGTLQPMLSDSDHNASIGRQAERFQALASDDESKRAEHRRRLGYHVLKLGSPAHDQVSVKLPSGRVELSINEIYGRPTDEVLQAINKQPESPAGQLWLRSVVSNESKDWLSRLLGPSWQDSRLGLAQKVELAADSRTEVTVGSSQSDDSKDGSKPSPN